MTAEQDQPSSDEHADAADEGAATQRWSHLPERVLPEDAVGTQAVPRAPEEVPDAGLAREQALWGAG